MKQENLYRIAQKLKGVSIDISMLHNDISDELDKVMIELSKPEQSEKKHGLFERTAQFFKRK
jgi:hypothetical protein